MKKIAFVLVVFTLVVIPAAAQTIYSNGPTNGNTDAWYINSGFIVSDTFNVYSSGSSIAGAEFAMWLFPGSYPGPCAHCGSGDHLTSAELSITSGENGGTTYFDQTVTFTQSGCSANSYGFNVCLETTHFNGPTLNAGTYWLNLQNASVPNGDPVYWDENSGPSLASENSVGSIPSESFTILGYATTCMCGCSANPNCQESAASTIPEPGTLLLLSSGVLGLAVLRRKLF